MGRGIKMRHLINPNESRILENAGDRVPIGLYSIAANTPRTKVFDLNHMEWDDYMKEFEKDRPVVVGVSVYTSPIFPEAVEIAKKLSGKTRLVAGGHHATAMPETLTPYFNSVVMGEGENNWMWSTPNGIVGKKTPDITRIKRAPMDLSQYNMQMGGKRTGTIITSRGCPYSCAFCGKLEDRVRYHNVQDVLDNIQEHKDAGFEAIYFLDDVFTLNKNRMRSIVEGVGLPYRVTTRANLVNKEKLEILADTGCEWMSMGIESGDDDILKMSQKGMTTEDNYKAVMLAGDRGINVKGFFIIGLPGETEVTARKTINWSKTLRNAGLTSADFYYLTPFPGTPIWKSPERFGITIRDNDFTKYLQAGKSAGCVIDTEELKAERIEELVKEAKAEWVIADYNDWVEHTRIMRGPRK